MIVAVIGLNHETATVKIRERASLSETGKIEMINRMLDIGVSEVCVLSTCGRTEIYIATELDKIDDYMKFCKYSILEYYGGEIDESVLYLKKNGKCIDHIFRVTTGLDSIVLGEDQILGQVKEANLLAMEVGGSSKVLNKLFREAITMSKKVRSELKISEHPLSLSYIGVKKIKEKIKDLTGKTVFFTGLGEMGSLALKSIMEEPVEKIIIAVRSTGKIDKEILSDERVKAVNFETRFDYVKCSDVIISATGAPHVIIEKEDVLDRKEELIILDLALPRDVEESIGEEEGIVLYDVDALKDISNENIKRRQDICRQAEVMMKEKRYEFIDWIHSLKADLIIKNWHKEIDSIKDDTMELFDRKLKITKKERMIVEKMLESSLKRLVRKPIVALKTEKSADKRDIMVNVIEELFSYEEEK